MPFEVKRFELVMLGVDVLSKVQIEEKWKGKQVTRVTITLWGSDLSALLYSEPSADKFPEVGGQTDIYNFCLIAGLLYRRRQRRNE